MPREQRLLEIAADLVGTPGKRYGRIVEEGLDCWGLIMEFYRRAGAPVDDFLQVEGHNRIFGSENCMPRTADLRNCFQQLEKPEPFCIVAYALMSKTMPDHVMILLKGNRCLNVDLGVGVHIVRLKKYESMIMFFAANKNLSVHVPNFIRI